MNSTLRNRLLGKYYAVIVEINNTWLDQDDNWSANGTLAAPYLLENGFELIESKK